MAPLGLGLEALDTTADHFTPGIVRGLVWSHHQTTTILSLYGNLTPLSLWDCYSFFSAGLDQYGYLQE